MPEPVPLRLGDAADFERAAAVLREAGFEEESICRRLGLESAWLVEPSSPRQRQLCRRETDRLALLIRLFLLGERVPAAELEPHLEEKSRDSFLSLDLLRAQDGAYWSPVTVSPVEGLLVASDRTCGPAGEPAAPLEDFVFSPNNPGTRNFLQLTPSEPVESFLDLGTGTGVAALAAEAFATRVVGVDIAERSAAFARFNQRLNGRHKTEIRVGDLYGPVEGTQFDRIVTHPPYVPSFSRHAIYRDGGLSGEDILQRVVEGLPRHLRPGGFFVAVCVGLDARQKQFEQRAREWLKAGEGEFDVLFALGDYKTPDEYSSDLARNYRESPVPVTEKWRGVFEEFQTALVVYGALVIRRRAVPGAHPAWTERRKMPADAASYLGWFRWRDRLSEPEERHKLLAAAPRLAPDLKLTVTHQVENGGLVPAAFRLQNGGRPFPAATEVDGWVASLMNRFDGRAAAGAVYEEMRKAGHLPQSLVTEHFIELLASLIERGFVEVENGV